jgi:hypothetical protein
VAQYSTWPATERRMGWAASRAWFTKAVGSLTDAKPVLAWGMVFLLIGAFCAILD